MYADDLPVHLGGDVWLAAIGARADPPADRVHDCPSCGGHLYERQRHLRATVRRDGRAKRPRSLHLFCDPDCLAGWLRVMRAD